MSLRRLFVVPLHLHPVRPQTHHPASAPHPSLADSAVAVLDRHAVDRLSLAGRPEKRTANEVAVLGMEDLVPVLVGPLLQQRPRPRVVPNDREDPDRDEDDEEHRLAAVGPGQKEGHRPAYWVW